MMFMADEEENAPIEIKEMLIYIISAMKFIGFPVESFSIKDILLHDINNINDFYQNEVKRFGDIIIKRHSYEFLVELFRNYGGRTLFDVLEKMYGKDALKIDKEEEKEIKNLVENRNAIIKVKSLSDLLGIIGKNTFKIVLVVSELKDKKLELEFNELESQRLYALEIDKDRVVCEDYDEDYYIANIKFDEKRGKYILYLTLLNEDEDEEEEEEEIEPFEIDKTSSIEENFERFVKYVVDVLNKRLEKEPEKIHYFTSVNYLKPFVEDFVNKIQTNWIYANLDRKLALKSFALYLAEQKGLNIERFKYLKEQYINIDIMLGTIILKQKILDKYANNYL